MATIQKLNTQELETKLELYNKACYEYYRTGDSIMTDIEFDTLKELLELNGYDFTYEDTEPIDATKETVNKGSIMGSLVKVQVFDEDGMKSDHMNQVANYLRQSDPNINKDTPILVGWKLDGNAIKILFNEDGSIEDIITRGGFSIKEKFIDVVSKQIKYQGLREIRCEAVMDKETFKERYLEQGFANPRNTAAGILNDENINDYRKADITFVQLNDGVSPTLSSNELTYIEIPLYQLPSIYKKFLEARPNYPYPNDGMVVYLKGVTEMEMKGKYPLHSLAIKFPPVKVHATIKDIEWNLRKSGKFIPKIILDPVELDGTTQRQVAAFNYGYVMENKLFPGAIIEVGKNGDIIAYVQRVIVPGNIANLKPLPEGSKVVDIHLMVDGEESQNVADTENFIAGCYTLGIKNFGYSWFKTLAKLCNNNIINLFNKDIINLSVLNSAFGGTKKQIEFMNAISNFDMDVYKMIRMLQFPNCGHRTSIQIAKFHSNLEYDFSGLQKDLVESLTTDVFTDNYRKFKTALIQLNEYGYDAKMLIEEKVTDYAATFEMTGSPKPSFNTKGEFTAAIPNWGHQALKKGTTYLVTNSPESNTGKMKKARQLGVEIITYEQAIEIYNSNN